MRNARALRNLFAWLGLVVLIAGVLGVPIGWGMQPAELGGLFLVIDAIAVLIAVLFFCCAAVLAALIELGPRSY
jgi:uncharacterized membrane protein